MRNAPLPRFIKMKSLSIVLFLILIPSPQSAETCDKDKENCPTKEEGMTDCGCSKLPARPPTPPEGPVPVAADSARESEEPVTPDPETDVSTPKDSEQTPETTEESSKHSQDDSTATEGEGSAAHEKEKYSEEANKGTAYPRTNQMSCLDGGLFHMGSSEVFLEGDGEGPARPVYLRKFCIDIHEVSIGEFERFVNATGHKTVAETMGDSFVVEFFVSNETKANVRNSVLDLPWWLPLKNATWKTPEGIDSNVTYRKDHAVVHVSYEDAKAYCKWAGKRLPTEAEWEYACRGGLHDRLFPWGNLQQPRSEHRLNIWTGKFPRENTAEDGHAAVAPVTEYLFQNKYGLKNMVGNVWEWVSDYWGTDVHTYPEDNPTGPAKGFDRTKKGGSFLCSLGYCYRYRCAARSSNSPDTTAYNLGFRCAADTLPDYIPPYDFKAALEKEEQLRKDGKVAKSPDDWVERVERTYKLASPGHPPKND